MNEYRGFETAEGRDAASGNQIKARCQAREPAAGAKFEPSTSAFVVASKVLPASKKSRKEVPTSGIAQARPVDHSFEPNTNWLICRS